MCRDPIPHPRIFKAQAEEHGPLDRQTTLQMPSWLACGRLAQLIYPADVLPPENDAFEPSADSNMYGFQFGKFSNYGSGSLEMPLRSIPSR